MVVMTTLAVEKIAVEDMPKVESDTLLMSLKSGIK